MVGEVLTVLPVGHICEEATRISPEKVSLPYSSRSTVLQSFFSLKMKSVTDTVVLTHSLPAI
jgi:hypothetical protein